MKYSFIAPLQVLMLASVVMAASACAQTPTEAPSAPQLANPTVVSPETGPTQVVAAHRVFLTNAGVDRRFPLSADDMYNTVSAALQAWGHYQLVSSPNEADLILELRGVSPINDITGLTGPQTSPVFELGFLDPATKASLWTVASPLNLAGLKKERARWKAVAVENLVTRLKMAAAAPVSSAEMANLSLAPENHHLRNLLLVPAVFIAVVIAIVLF